MSERQPDQRRCPVCGKPPEERLRPFCSKRCADLDLAHWLRGDYAIPAREDSEGEEEAVEDSDEDDGSPET